MKDSIGLQAFYCFLGVEILIVEWLTDYGVGLVYKHIVAYYKHIFAYVILIWVDVTKQWDQHTHETVIFWSLCKLVNINKGLEKLKLLALYVWIDKEFHMLLINMK